MKILVALDGSDAAYNALGSACYIAAKAGFSVVAFYTNKGDLYSPEETGWSSIKERITKELADYGHEVIRRAYDIGRERDVPVEGMVADGIPADEILKYITTHGIIKLVAMGHSSKGRGTQEFVESTTKNILVEASVPVLVTSSDIQIRKILIAVDDSEISRRVTRFGGSFAKSLGADLGLISTVPDIEAMIHEYRMIAEVPNIEKHIETSERKLNEIIEKALSQAKDILHGMDIRPDSIVKKGQPDEIVSEAGNYDLLIFGLKNDSSPRKIGKIANKLLNNHSVNTIFMQ